MTDQNPSNQTAALIFYDNSDTSIDGDYRPTRIQAEKETVESFCDFFRRGNIQSVFGCGGMADADFGLKVSFCSQVMLISKNLKSIKTGGKIHLDRAIRSGILAMNQRPKEAKNQVLIFLIGSQHDLTNEKAESIAAIAHGKGICINIFVFGDEDIDEEPLKHLIEKMNDSSHYNRIPSGMHSLSSAIISQYCSNFNTKVPESSLDMYKIDDDDAELRNALQASLLEAGGSGVDAEMQAAIEASMREINQQNNQDDEEMDPELRDALALSVQPLDEEQDQNNKPEPKKDEIHDQITQLMNDPNQLNDILTEFGGSSDNKDKKDDKNKKDDKDDKDKKDDKK